MSFTGNATYKELYPQREKIYKVGDTLTFNDEKYHYGIYAGTKWMLIFNPNPAEIHLVGLDKDRGIVWGMNGIKKAYRDIGITECMIAKHFGVEFLEV